MERIERSWGRVETIATARTWRPITMSSGEPRRRPRFADLDDRALVAACVAGTRLAFDLIVERHRRGVSQVCYRFLEEQIERRTFEILPNARRARRAAARQPDR